MGQNTVVTSLKFASVATLAACAFSWWLQASVLDTIGISAWRAIGVTGAIIVGAIGTALTRAWFSVPVVVAVGLGLGATWTEWRAPSDVHASFFKNIVPAISIYGSSLLAPGALAATVGVVLVRFRAGKRVDIDI